MTAVLAEPLDLTALDFQPPCGYILHKQVNPADDPAVWVTYWRLVCPDVRSPNLMCNRCWSYIRDWPIAWVYCRNCYRNWPLSEALIRVEAL